MEYVAAIDHLLGLVGQQVLVRVSAAAEHPGFATLSGALAQGEREVFDTNVSFFGIGSGSDGIYIYRDDFGGASYDAEYERLTIWLGPVAISIEPRGY